MVVEEIAAVAVLPLWAVAIIFIVLALLLVLLLKRLLVNTVLGVIALLVVNWLGASYGLKLSITVLTVIICAIFGLAGVGGLIIAELLGFHVA